MGEMEKWGEMGGSGGKWGGRGEMQVIGGIWGIVGNCQQYSVGSVEKMCEIGRKLEKSGSIQDKFPIFPSPIFPTFRNLATFPSSSFDAFCHPNWPTGKMGISGLADTDDG